MFSNIGMPGLILIVVIALIIFGPAKLPQLGRAAGDTLRQFRNSTKGVVDEITEGVKEEEKKEGKIDEPKKVN